MWSGSDIYLIKSVVLTPRRHETPLCEETVSLPDSRCEHSALWQDTTGFTGWGCRWEHAWRQCKVGRTATCVKTCNSQDTMSATWRKERSTVETNEIMTTAAHRSESWCWRQLLSLLSHVLILVLTQLVCGRPKERLYPGRSRLMHYFPQYYHVQSVPCQEKMEAL
jgi:hypothetical protein